MYMANEKMEDGSMKSFMDYSPKDIIDKSIFSIKQDVRLLDSNIVELGLRCLKTSVAKHNLDLKAITYFLPHLSSYYFKEKIANALDENNMHIPEEKWFTNLKHLGNVGAASIFLMVDELKQSNKLKVGDQLLLMVPESARFSYVYCLLSVC